MIKLFRKKLPHCDILFEKYFSAWYPENERPKMTRPDMYVIAGYDGSSLNLEEIQYLQPEYLASTKKFINETMLDAALADFQEILQSDELSLDLLDAVDKHYNRSQISRLLKSSDPTDFSNPYLVTVC